MLQSWSSPTELLIHYRDISSWILGALIFAECTALVGLLFPATVTMIGIGGLIGAGLLDPIVASSVAVTGAVLGGSMSFAIGRVAGPHVHRWERVQRHQAIVLRSESLFRRFGLLLIFVARFYAPARATVPLLAGMMKMKSRPFVLVDTAAAIFWVSILFWIGSTSAAALENVSVGSTGKVALFVVLAIAMSSAGTFAMKKLLSAR